MYKLNYESDDNYDSEIDSDEDSYKSDSDVETEDNYRESNIESGNEYYDSEIEQNYYDSETESRNECYDSQTELEDNYRAYNIENDDESFTYKLNYGSEDDYYASDIENDDNVNFNIEYFVKDIENRNSQKYTWNEFLKIISKDLTYKQRNKINNILNSSKQINEKIDSCLSFYNLITGNDYMSFSKQIVSVRDKISDSDKINLSRDDFAESDGSSKTGKRKHPANNVKYENLKRNEDSIGYSLIAEAEKLLKIEIPGDTREINASSKKDGIINAYNADQKTIKITRATMWTNR